MPSPIIRGNSVTAAEEYLKHLCEKTFLSLWSYPAIYRDQRSSARSEGKELADLLVVFGDEIIIFSDKHCSFPNSGNLKLDWSRWFRSAVVGGARQGWGAERWIRQNPDRLFLDRACTERFPYDLPDLTRARFHIVVVAHDVARACATSLGGSGSLIICNDLRGIADHVIP